MVTSDCLTTVITASEASQIWRLNRKTVSMACKRGLLPCRQSGQTWLVTLYDMLVYRNGSYWPDMIPEELRPAFGRALEQWKANQGG